MRPRKFPLHAAILCVLAPAVLACSSNPAGGPAGGGRAGGPTASGGSASGGGGGTGFGGAPASGGGPATSGGAGGSTTSGVAGGGGAAGDNVGGAGGTGQLLVLPTCLTKLMAECEPKGLCRASVAGICFFSGVHATNSTAANPLACGGETSITTVTKPDGSLCYSFESYRLAAFGCEGSPNYVWKDAAGTIVASGGGFDRFTTSVACTNEPGSASCTRTESELGVPYSCCDLTSFGTSYCPDRLSCPSAGICP